MGRPWWVQFLAGQHGQGHANGHGFGHGGFNPPMVTKKYPSDSEDQDTGTFVTLKYPSDSDEGDFTPGQ